MPRTRPPYAELEGAAVASLGTLVPVQTEGPLLPRVAGEALLSRRGREGMETLVFTVRGTGAGPVWTHATHVGGLRRLADRQGWPGFRANYAIARRARSIMRSVPARSASFCAS